MDDNAIYPRYRWFVLAVVSFIITLAYMNLMAYAPIMGQIAKDLNIDIAATTNFLSGSMFVLGKLGSAAGIFVGGIAVARTGSFAAAVGTISIATIVAAILAYFLKARHRTEGAEEKTSVVVLGVSSSEGH